MARKRNRSRKRQKASVQQNGRKQTTVGTIIVALVGLAYWWFTGSSPDALLNNNEIDAVEISATATVAEVAQASDDADTQADSTSEDSADDGEAAVDEADETEPPVTDTPVPAATNTSVSDSTVTDTSVPDPTATDISAPDPTAMDTPVPDPTATATTPPKPADTATPRPRGPPGMPEIHIDDLPPEARDTIDLIFSGGPFPFDRDGITFQNREGILPDRQRGYYEEYTVITPGLSHRGARRIVIGREDEMYYTDDHYESFSWIAED